MGFQVTSFAPETLSLRLKCSRYSPTRRVGLLQAMLEYLAIFGRGGAILWTFGQLLNVKGNPINNLIQTCLLEDRSAEKSYIYRPPTGTHYTLKWKFHNVRPPTFYRPFTDITSRGL
jgi:hypothetical protein